jgi:dTMP kinase
MTTFTCPVGKLIVIEGIDGCGKGTQIQLLKSFLEGNGCDTLMLDFPRYGNPAAFFVEKYLRGEYGTAEEVGPYMASILYAVDRFDMAKEIKSALAQGRSVISNRYTTASMGHQAGKIADIEKRNEYVDWLSKLEYETLEIPKPDAVVYLTISPELGQLHVDKKEQRSYLINATSQKRDIHEDDAAHLSNAATAFNQVASRNNWHIIDCMKDGHMQSPEVIHNLIVDILVQNGVIQQG